MLRVIKLFTSCLSNGTFIVNPSKVSVWCDFDFMADY